MDLKKMENQVEAVLFASGEPVSFDQLCACCETDPRVIRVALENLAERLGGTALQLLQVGEAYQLATNPEYGGVIRRTFESQREAPLSQAALEVLSIVAYNEPVTRSFIEQIRGVDSSGVVGSLVEKGLLQEAGRLDLPGRPISYRTTANFLRSFSLSSLEELPSAEQVLKEQAALFLQAEGEGNS